MGILKDYFSRADDAAILPSEPVRKSTEIGARTTPENELKYLYRIMWVDPELRQAILDVREMDRCDGRVKRIHSRVARDAIKGGLELQQSTENKTLSKEWEAFGRRLQLNRVEKLKSDARGLVMEGNLPLQVVLNNQLEVAAAIRMPAETILPNVQPNGQFKDPRKAYIQFDVMTGAEKAAFPLWQLHMCRYDPDSFDDMGSLGRPFLDANRSVWRKLRMTEEDLVIRRRVRAPLRLNHVLEGASPEELETYRKGNEQDQDQISTDFYQNKKGGVTGIQGDANLDQVKDVALLLDCFFAGSPMPKGLMGYTDQLARDILDDLKRDYYEEVDSFQDTLAFGYEQVFRIHLLLKGINPDADDFCLGFTERSTETENQRADRGLKMQALGFPFGMVWQEMGYDPAYVRERIEWERKNFDPYPAGPGGDTPGKVSITPGNQRKGESGTSIRNSEDVAELRELLAAHTEGYRPIIESITAALRESGRQQAELVTRLSENRRAGVPPIEIRLKNERGQVVKEHRYDETKKAWITTEVTGG